MDKYHDSFPIRAYTKKELALCYFPHATPHAAINRLREWMARNRQLMDELEGMGYEKNSRWLSPRQVEVILGHLGEP